MASGISSPAGGGFRVFNVTHDPSMTRDRYARIAEIFHRVNEAMPADRARTLRELCGGDDALEAEVGALLSKSSDEPTALDEPALGRDFLLGGAEALGEEPDLSAIAIEGCRVTRLIGRGAMGAVYEAEQERPRRTVAVKVLHRCLHSREVRRRFEFEAEVLARLHHPNIASVYGAGVTADGAMPYFIMEYVQGARPITTFAREANLSINSRIGLLLKVCDAVAYGHRQGIIHRDIKPENILVDASGQPKVIDFGIAKIIGEDAPALTLAAGAATLIGTLQYMSPEQCDERTRDLDARTDVYSLGMVLHELIAGRPPYDVSGLSVAEAARVICDAARPPSDGLAESPRDLALIIAKAIEAERGLRYESAAELADDLRRFLRHEPVQARPPGTLYVLRKFARRHRAATAAGVATAFTLLAGAVVSTIFAIEAMHQREAAENALTEQRAVAALMLDIMQSSLGSYETVSKDDLLLGAEQYLRKRPAMDAGIEATLREYVGSGWLIRGELRRAREQLPEALRLRRDTGKVDESFANCLYLNARLRMLTGEPDEVRQLLRETLTVRRRVLGGDHMRSADESFTNSIWAYLPEEPEGRAAIAALENARAMTAAIDDPPPGLESEADLALVFEDDFSEAALSPEWSLATSNLDGWDLFVAESRCELRAMEIASPGQASLTLSREFEPLSDFHCSMQVSWRQQSVRDMGSVRIELIGHDDVVMLRSGFTDGWIDWYGGISASFYPTRTASNSFATTGVHSLPLEGSATIDIIRRAGRTTVYRDGKEFLPGVMTEELARISISFIGHERTDAQGREAQFAPLAIHSIRLSGQPVNAR